MPFLKRDNVGNAIRHFNQKIRDENEFGKTEKHFPEKEFDREERHKVDELNLFETKALLEGNKTIQEVLCDLKSYAFHAENDRRDYCNSTWDGVLCWEPTLAGSTAYLPCPEEFNEIKYDTSENASKECFANGTWSTYTNYNLCQPIEISVFEGAFDVNTTALTSLLYSIGYSISLVALLIAMSIFLYFKDLRCLRNTIHTNLMFTYAMADFMWILTINLQNVLQTDMTICILLTLALHYFYITTFFWMFVEGLYLYMLVVETFNRKSIKSYVYISVGWGIPVAVIIIWTIAKATGPLYNDSISDDIPIGHFHCHWINATVYDWIFKVPMLTVMALNSVFLVMIMWARYALDFLNTFRKPLLRGPTFGEHPAGNASSTNDFKDFYFCNTLLRYETPFAAVLITKLRSANNVETQQYRKAAKALMVLIPLLGVTYILTIVSSTEGPVAQFFYNLRAFMLSSQGFLVALFYCFLNSEVQNTIRHHFESWSAARTLGGDRRYTYSKDWSPRSGTESIRLYSQPTVPSYRKRESCVSETTTTIMVNNAGYNNGDRVSDGCMTGAGGSAKVTTPFLNVTAEKTV